LVHDRFTVVVPVAMFVPTFRADGFQTTPGVVRVDATALAVTDAADTPSAFGAVVLLCLLCAAPA
jgi:hypothetical protein